MIKQLRQYFLRSFNAVDYGKYRKLLSEKKNLKKELEDLVYSNNMKYKALNQNQKCYYELSLYGFTHIDGYCYERKPLRCPVTGRFIKDDS